MIKTAMGLVVIGSVLGVIANVSSQHWGLVTAMAAIGLAALALLVKLVVDGRESN